MKRLRRLFGFVLSRPRSFESCVSLERKSAFIIGNGPSLLKHDLSILDGIPSFASNSIFLIFPKTNWRPDYYSCVDTAVLPDQASEISRWVKRLDKTQFFFPELIVIHDGSNRGLVPVKDIIRPAKNVSYFKYKNLNLNGRGEEVFALPQGVGLVESMTVTILLMQAAVRLGAKRLFLIGCDNYYVIPEGATILDQDNPRIDKRIFLNTNSDPNHFDASYFGEGKVWHTPNVHLMTKHYEKSYLACKEYGIEVINAGYGGALEVFPRMDYLEAVEKAKEE